MMFSSLKRLTSSGSRLRQSRGPIAKPWGLQSNALDCRRAFGVSRAAYSFVLLLIYCLELAETISVAQDRILVQQPGGSRFPISGVVDDFTGRELTIRLKAGEKLKAFPRDQVVEVQTSYTLHHERGRQLLKDGKIVEATSSLNAALKEEDRTWVRREILALLVKAAMWDGDYRTAVTRFLPILESDEETFHFDVAPLAWSDDLPNGAMVQAAKGWLAGKSSGSKLFGASHLLNDPESGGDAEAALRFLARDSNVRIQRLAQMQIWRQRMKSGAASANELARWESAIEELPVEIRAGGYYVLGQAHIKQRSHDQAATALLWLPLIFDNDRHLSARACFQAAEQLELIGQKPQAANLYGEVALRFGDTPFAANAETKWKELSKTSP